MTTRAITTPVEREITSVLVANRGEIACRVFATCRAMGIATVAVYSDPDADAPHVRQADAAVHLPGSTSAETYLRGELIIAAARAAGADAIHPGYGFLSENADFAQAVIDAGLVWIGPPPSAITAMGSKVNAKELMAAAGVPVLGDLDPTTVTAADLPLLIKASAGGGGRGMRIVRALADLDDQVAGAKREAESAFGDPTVFCEPYVERGHHIEVQVMADDHGAVWAVGERECSIQRRHQKVIEEAPSPLVESLGGDLRDRLYDAARKSVAAIGYSGAGTVEFLADGNGRFFFLETNTRLQVEHPVTEETTGLDLVEWQLRVAMGEPLVGDEPRATGHSIEARLYAENPAAEWAPQSGTVHRFAIAASDSVLSRVRVDTGIADGSEISTFYDPMIAKVISWAPTRHRAAAVLARALADATLHGPVTNRDMLVNTLRDLHAYLGGAVAVISGRPMAQIDAFRIDAGHPPSLPLQTKELAGIELNGVRMVLVHVRHDARLRFGQTWRLGRGQLGTVDPADLAEPADQMGPLHGNAVEAAAVAQRGFDPLDRKIPAQQLRHPFPRNSNNRDSPPRSWDSPTPTSAPTRSKRTTSRSPSATFPAKTSAS